MYWPNLYNSFVQVKLFRSIKSVQVITCTKFEKDFVQVITCTTQPYKLQLVQDFVQVITCTKSQLVHDIYIKESDRKITERIYYFQSITFTFQSITLHWIRPLLISNYHYYYQLLILTGIHIEYNNFNHFKPSGTNIMEFSEMNLWEQYKHKFLIPVQLKSLIYFK